jgi:hypothetical protein
MTDNNERARFDAWWLGEDGPYSIRAERPSSMTEAAWAGWRAREAENAKLRAALEEITLLPGEINHSNYDHDDVVALNNSFAEAFHIACAALGGENDA